MKQTLVNTFAAIVRHFWDVLWKNKLGLSVLTLIFLLVQTYINELGTDIPAGPVQDKVRILKMMTQLCWSLLFSLILALYIPIRYVDYRENRQTQWGAFLKKMAWPLTLESLRVLGWVLLWTMALIIPGIYKQIRYIFVPFVVLFDPEYHEGKVDALEESNSLTKGLVFAFIILGLILATWQYSSEVVLRGFDPEWSPIPYFGILALKFLVEIFSWMFLTELYFQRHQGRKSAEIGGANESIV